jgi:hypothetical protein
MAVKLLWGAHPITENAGCSSIMVTLNKPQIMKKYFRVGQIMINILPVLEIQTGSI